MRETTDQFKKRVIRILTKLKNEQEEAASSPRLPIYEKGKVIAYLRVASKSSLDNKKEIENLAKWRKMHAWWFPAQFKVTLSGTKKWFKEQVLEKEDRFLFIIETPNGIPFGHMGLYRFDFERRSCEIDNVLRGRDDVPGAMTLASKVLISWAFSVLRMKMLALRVFKDNIKAIKLYNRCGFQITKEIPLKKVESEDRVEWIESDKENDKAQRYFVEMKLLSTN